MSDLLDFRGTPQKNKQASLPIGPHPQALDEWRAVCEAGPFVGKAERDLQGVLVIQPRSQTEGIPVLTTGQNLILSAFEPRPEPSQPRAVTSSHPISIPDGTKLNSLNIDAG